MHVFFGCIGVGHTARNAPVVSNVSLRVSTGKAQLVTMILGILSAMCASAEGLENLLNNIPSDCKSSAPFSVFAL